MINGFAREAEYTVRERPPFVSVALISAGALAYELLLLRLFSIIQWHHFAYMAISLAMLGIGASGTFLALLQGRLLPHFRTFYIACLAVFGPATVGCYALAQRVDFHPEEIFWGAGQLLHLVIIYLLLSIPFFFSGCAVGISLIRYQKRIPMVYAADLTGAGFGSLILMAGLVLVFPLQCLALVGLIGVCATVVALCELRMQPRLGLIVLVAVITLPALIWSWRGELLISPYKPLSQATRVVGARVIEQLSGPLGLVTVVANDLVPLRYAPGLSLHAVTGPPPQLGIFTDAGNMSAITASSDKSPANHFDQLTSALPYHLGQPKTVLVLGAGGGSGVLQALRLGAKQVDAVELNSNVVHLVGTRFQEFSGGLYQRPEVRVHTGDARGFVAVNRKSFDLIQLNLLDTYSTSISGLNALGENYLYTVEAFQSYFKRLSPNGYLAITRWLRVPPRDALKLLMTSVDALRSIGVDNPKERIVLIRSWATSTLLVKNSAVTSTEIAALRHFCAKRGFDLAYYPTMPRTEANRYNVLRQPWFFDGATAVLSDKSEEFIAQYKFDITPATDNRPYFARFLKWRTVPEILSLWGQGGGALMEWGYMVLIATLIQAIAGSVLLVLVPLGWLRRRHPQRRSISQFQLVICFAAIGLAFLFIEMVFIQRFVLFLHQPIYSAVAVLTSFLIFAALGATWAHRFSQRGRPAQGIVFAVVGICLIATSYVAALGPVFNLFSASSLLIRLGVTSLLIAPLAFCMGMPFPLALVRVAAVQPTFVPWAWAINSSASVVSAVLAMILAVHFGFTLVVLLAMALYVLALLSLPKNGQRVPWA